MVEKTMNDEDLTEWRKWSIVLTERSAFKFDIADAPSAQPEISRIEQELHGKTPEEQYEFLYWLLLKFGLAYTDSRLAVIEWLRGEKEDG